MLPLLVGSVPGFRSLLVKRVDDWLNEDGTLAYYIIAGLLAGQVTQSLHRGDYSFADEFFALVERLLEDGCDDVKNLMATGFLEALQNQDILPSPLWTPLLGKQARDYLIAWDRFNGASTPGLDN